jgi:hypothetical protein
MTRFAVATGMATALIAASSTVAQIARSGYTQR